ncbi:nematode cuticle collagen domain protein [Cooperia oncophora]
MQLLLFPALYLPNNPGEPFVSHLSKYDGYRVEKRRDNMADYYVKEPDESERLRRVTFIAVLISTTAVLSTVVTLPLIYNYIQAMQTHMSSELDHCRTKYNINVKAEGDQQTKEAY